LGRLRLTPGQIPAGDGLEAGHGGADQFAAHAAKREAASASTPGRRQPSAKMPGVESTMRQRRAAAMAAWSAVGGRASQGCSGGAAITAQAQAAVLGSSRQLTVATKPTSNPALEC
jgi:hypothetical protein